MSRRHRWAYFAIALVNRISPKQRSHVALHSAIDIEDGILAVAEALWTRGQRPTVLMEDMARADTLRRLIPGRLLIVPKWSREGIVAYLRAKHVITTDDVFGGFGPPAYQNLVNIWHGEPPSKVTGRFGGQGGLHCTYAPVCSTVGRAYRSVEFGISPERVPIIGAPRNDRMLRADSTRVRRELVGLGVETAFIWLPSFRVGSLNGRIRSDLAGAQSGNPFTPEQMRRLDERLSIHNATIVVKHHPRDVQQFVETPAIRILTPGELERRGMTLYTVLSAFDCLITDVSSVWVDYLLLDKPMIFAFPDIEDYRRGRGLNLEPYEGWVPGAFARDAAELESAVNDVIEGNDPFAEERRKARQRFHRFDDDQSTDRLLNALGIYSPTRATSTRRQAQQNVRSR